MKIFVEIDFRWKKDLENTALQIAKSWKKNNPALFSIVDFEVEIRETNLSLPKDQFWIIKGHF
ncbi:hypothetical protein E4S40_10800 [Algoriphagus kandeliae]|uniref:Uncharacterized protein n=1 Tax=Algoriphagus kandeliae TaxID=2562278 RepID=A0A4Y9QPE4_9BACT|nr:hypothetical protein [Algoriphagus kandeliae]TFV94501.1 hypothetical protein E4S40_10800 [Algoriphagus kandeliae]